MSLWQKITGHDDDEPKAVATEQSGHPKDLPPPVPVAEHTATTPSGKESNWHDKFRDLLDHGAANKREAEAERLRLERERIEKEQAALKAEHEANSFHAKLKGLFKDGDEEAEKKRLDAEAEQKRLAAERAKVKEDGWTAKIKDVFDDDDEEKERERQKLAEAAKQDQSFGARVRDIFGSHHTPKDPPKERGWLHEHVTSTFGGGEQAEKKEDTLDKTIDLFQKHVLREGDQSNESAREQAKDKVLADSIRKITGHDKDKDK